MITKYTKFNEAEDWSGELSRNSKELASSIISTDQLEDYFLELTDEGSSLSISIRPGYFEGHFTGVGKKLDLVENECYPFYNIDIHSKNFDNCDTGQTIKKLDFYKNFTEKIISAQRRIVHFSDSLEVAQSSIYMETMYIKARILIKVKNKIDPIQYNAPVGKSTLEKLLRILNTNRIFTNIRQVSNTIYFSVNQGSTSRDTSSIIESIFKIFGPKVNIRKVGYDDDGRIKYKIEIRHRYL